MGNATTRVKTAKSLTDRTSFGNKAISVALSVVLLGFGWPAVNPSQAYAEDQAAETSQVEGASNDARSDAPVVSDAAQNELSADDAASTGAPEAADGGSVDSGAAAEGAAGSEAEPAGAESKSDAVQGSGTDADDGTSVVALSLGNASISCNGQTLALPATSVTVPNSDDFAFSVSPDTGYVLDKVEVQVKGEASASEVEPDEFGLYKVSASDVKTGAKITLKTKKVPATDIVAGDSPANEDADSNSNADAGEGAIAGSEKDPEAVEIGKDTVIGKDNETPDGEIETGEITDVADVSSPAFEGYAEAGGVLVKVTAGEGVIPEGTTVHAGWVVRDDVVSAVESVLSQRGLRLESYIVLDIALVDPSGNIIQPSDAVNVCFFDNNIQDGAVFRVSDDASVVETVVAPRQTDAGCTSFDVSHFSMYMLAKTSSAVANDASLSISPREIELKQGESSRDLVATVIPSDAVVTWQSDDPNIATVDPATGEVTAVGVGTTTIVATAGGHSDSASVTVKRNTDSYTEQDAYFYLARPDLPSASANDLTQWLYAGMGTVHVPADKVMGMSFASDIDELIVQAGAYYEDKTFTVRGKTYRYDADGTGADGTFSVEWDVVKVSPGSTNSNRWDGESGSDTRLTPSNSADWHVDGHAILHDEQFSQITFYIQEAGKSGYTQADWNGNASLTDGAMKVVTASTKMSDLRVPSYPATRVVGGVTYHFDGWYVDGRSATKADFASSEEVGNANRSFYARYVPNFALTVAGYDAPYDGELHGLTVNAPEGVTVEYNVDASGEWSTTAPEIRDVGTKRVSVRATVGDVVKQVEATLKVTPAPLTVTTGSDSKAYDGEPLTNGEIDVDGLVNGETLGYEATGSVTEVGTAENSYELTWADAGNDYTAQQSNYDVVENLGKLEITEAEKSLAIEGPDTVSQFDTISLSAVITPANLKGTYKWSSSNDNILTVDQNGKVEGVLKGTATVTCEFTSEDGETVLTATHEVTVTESTQAGAKTKFYYLNNPNANLDDIKTSAAWTSMGDGMVNYAGISWKKDNGYTKIYDRLGDRIVSWPDGSTGPTYSVARGTAYWNDIVKSYQSEIQKQLPGETITDDMIDSITLIPYKMTYNDDGVHVDCRVEVKCASLLTAKYFVKDPSNASSSGFAEVAGSISYRVGDTTDITDLVPDFDAKYPQTKTVDGVEYTFDGWYTDIALTKRAVLPHTMTDNVSFYAKYVSGRQVIYNLAGGSWNNSDAHSYAANEGSTQTVKDEPTREGYKFLGWTVDGLEGKTDVASGDTFVMPDNNVIITAQWHELLSCTIKYVEKSTGAELKASEKKYGEAGDAVSASAGSFAGYHLVDSPESVEVTLGEDGSDQIVFFYEKDAVHYTVNHFLNGTEIPVAASETLTSPWGVEVSAADVAKSLDEYTVVPGQTASIVLSLDGDNTINVYYYKNVSLTAKSDTFTYDGARKTVSGFDGAPSDADFSALTVGAEGVEAGNYDAAFDASAIGTVDATARYIVTSAADGVLTINPCNDAIVVTIVGNKGADKYDGTEHSVSGYTATVTQNGAVTGLYDVARDVEGPAQSDAIAKGTNAGNYDMGLAASSFANKNKNFANVTFDVVDGSLSIDKRQVTLRSEDGNKNYDGKTLQRRTNIQPEGDGFVGDDGILPKEKLSWDDENNIMPGVYDNKFTPAYTPSTNLSNYDITIVYGKLTINSRPDSKKYELVVEGNSATETYDGTVHSVSGLKNTTYTSKEGVVFTISADTSDPSLTDAGTSANEVSNVKVTDPAGNDVTDQFKVTTTDGALTVNPRTVTITAGSAEKEYDGSALTADQADPQFTTEGFVSGQGIESCEVEGSRTQVGTANSTVKDGSWKFSAGTNGDNYDVRTVPGTLTVKNRTQQYAITLTGKSDTVTYDGEPHAVEGVEQDTFTFDGVEYAVSNYSANAEGTTAGTYTNTVTSGEGGFVVTDPDGNDVSSQFSVNVAPGKLVVNKRPVLLTAGSASKVYDGEALTVGGTSFTASDPTDNGTGGFVEGQGITWAKIRGSQTEVGTSASTFAFKVSGAKTDFDFIAGTDPNNYDFSYEDGTLEVTPNEDEVVVTIVENSGNAVYDGTEQSVAGYKVTNISNSGYHADDFEFVGDDAAKTATGTDAGVYDMNLAPSDFRNMSSNFTNVTFEIVDGTLTIAKRAITLQSDSDEKEYDGTALTNDNVSVAEGTLVSGDAFAAQVSGSQTNAGTSDNSFTYTLVDKTGAELAKDADGTYKNYDVTVRFGTLKVAPVSSEVVVVITGNHVTGTYNGSEVNATGYTFSSNNDLYTADKVALSGTDSVSRVNAGKSTMGLPGKFSNADAVNFPNVRFEVNDGYVEIAKAEVTLQSADLSKPYDGTALVNGTEPLAVETGWAEGEGATYTFTGSQTTVGSCENAFTYELNANTNADNYLINATNGTLTVTNRDAKYSITVEANSSTDNVYDGTEHSATGLKTSTFVIDGHTYYVSGLTTEDPVEVNAGSYTNNITGTPVVRDANGNDVSSEFEVTPVNGVLEIAKRSITLTSSDDEKEYDGTELTNHDVTIGGAGFVGYDGVICRFTGSQTEVGGERGNNEFSYIFDVGTIPTNYDVSLVYGTLTVKPVSKQVVVVIDGNTGAKTYNGEEQRVTGYRVVSISNPLFSESDIDFAGNAEAVGKDASDEPYPMGLTEGQFSNKKPSVFANVKFVVNDGSLSIAKRSVKLTAASDSKEYDGTPLTNSTVTEEGDGFVPGEVANVRAEGSVTEVGIANNEVRYDPSASFKASNYDIDVKPGTLEVTAGRLDAQSVTWVTNDVVKLYDGAQHQAGVASATDKHGNALTVEYSVDNENWTTDPATITAKNYSDSTPIYLRATSPNYAEGQYSTAYELLAISERFVTLTSASDSKTYDGTALTNDTVRVSSEGFAEGEGATYDVTGSQTAAGSSDNAFTYELNGNTLAENYVITKNYGTLQVLPSSAEVVVTITEHSDEIPYDGEAHEVSGYDVAVSTDLYGEGDFAFTGDATARGTEVGTYDMNLTPSDFRNINDSFTKVTFRIVDGALTITPKSADAAGMTVEAPEDVTYNGKSQQEKPVVKDGDKTLEEGVDYTLSYSPDTTNAGEVIVTVTGKGNYGGTVDTSYRIRPAVAVVTTESNSKVYDGTPVIAPGSIALVNGETAEVAMASSRTEIGESPNDEYAINWNGSAKESNYTVETGEIGTLEVTAQSLNPGDAAYRGAKVDEPVDVMYDGADHMWAPEVTDGNGFVLTEGTDYTVSYNTTDFKNVTGAIEVTITGAGNYSGTVTRTYQITKRPVVLGSNTRSKTYDGAPLTDDEAFAVGYYDFVAGDVSAVEATGSIVNPGSVSNDIEVIWANEGVANNYDVITYPGTLTVNAKSIVSAGMIVEAPNDVTYNGLDQYQKPVVKDGDKTLEEGVDYTLSTESDTVNAGKVTIVVAGIGNYTGTTEVFYHILKAPLSVVTESESKAYDGTPLTAGGTLEGLVNNETATFTVTGSQTAVGSSENTYSIVWDGTAVASNYSISEQIGTLTVTESENEIVVTTTGYDGPYTGLPHGATVAVTNLPAGYTAEASSNAEATDANGEGITATADNLVIRNTNGEDVTDALTVTYVDGLIKISPVELTVSTPSASKVYDGAPLTAEGSISGFVAGETATFETTGSQTEVGASTNTYRIIWNDNAKEGNYTINDDDLGTLTVAEYAGQIIVRTTGGTFTYDAAPHGATDVTVSELPAGYTLERAQSTTTVTNVDEGVKAVTADDLVILNAEGKDVTSQLNIAYVDGTIEITPAPIEVTTGGASKYYDGTPLVKDELKIEGIVEGDQIIGKVTGSQTAVGSSSNTYELSGASWDHGNYVVVKEGLGMLTVYAPYNPPSPDPDNPNPPEPTPDPDNPPAPPSPDTPNPPEPTPGPDEPEAPSPTPNPATPATPVTPTAPETPAGPATPTAPAANPVAEALVGVYNAITGDDAAVAPSDQPAEERIYDAENPLGIEKDIHCWVHFYMIVFMALTVLYGAVVVTRRANFTRRLCGNTKSVLSGNGEKRDE